MRVVTAKIPEELVEELEKWSKILRLTKSELIRRAVKHYIKQLEAEHGIKRIKVVRVG